MCSRRIIEELKNNGMKFQKLNPKNSELLQTYREFIYDFETKGLTKKEIKDIQQDLEEELFNVEMFLCYLQEHKHKISYKQLKEGR